MSAEEPRKRAAGRLRAAVGLAVAVLGGAFAFGCFGAPPYVGPPSDHFDGEEFRNMGPFKEPSYWDVLTWKLTGPPSKKWPDWVDFPAAEPPPARVSEGMRITFVNHATVLVQLENLNILTDPVWSESVGPTSWLGPERHKAPGIPFEKLPKVDVVLISHNHYDHLDMPTLARLAERDQPLILAGLGTSALLDDDDIAHAEDLDWWSSRDVGKVRITFAPAQHWSTRGLGDRNVNLWGSFFISAPGQSVYFAGDTGNGPHFAAIRKRLGAPTVALLPIGAYEPRWFMHPQHINPAEAVEAHRVLGAERSVGIHFGTFDQTDEGMDQPQRDLAEALRAQGVDSRAFVALENGAAISVTRPKPKALPPPPQAAPSPTPTEAPPLRDINAATLPEETTSAGEAATE